MHRSSHMSPNSKDLCLILAMPYTWMDSLELLRLAKACGKKWLRQSWKQIKDILVQASTSKRSFYTDQRRKQSRLYWATKRASTLSWFHFSSQLRAKTQSQDSVPWLRRKHSLMMMRWYQQRILTLRTAITTYAKVARLTYSSKSSALKYCRIKTWYSSHLWVTSRRHKT